MNPTPIQRGPGRPRQYPVTPIVPELPDLPPQPPTTIPLAERLCLTFTEACAYIGLSESSLRNMIAEGRIVAKHYGKKPLIVRSSLDAFIADLPDYTYPERSR